MWTVHVKCDLACEPYSLWVFTRFYFGHKFFVTARANLRALQYSFFAKRVWTCYCIQNSTSESLLRTSGVRLTPLSRNITASRCRRKVRRRPRASILFAPWYTHENNVARTLLGISKSVDDLISTTQFFGIFTIQWHTVLLSIRLPSLLPHSHRIQLPRSSRKFISASDCKHFYNIEKKSTRSTSSNFLCLSLILNVVCCCWLKSRIYPVLSLR